MSGELILSGGGATSVASDELLTQERLLHALAARLDESEHEVSCLLLESVTPAPAWSHQSPEPHLLGARAALADAASQARRLARALSTVGEEYGAVERGATGMLQLWSAQFGFLFGQLARVLPGLIAAHLPALGGGAIGALLAWGRRPSADHGNDDAHNRADNGTDRSADQSTDHGNDNSDHTGSNAALQQALGDPAFIQFVRHAVSSVDDMMMGFQGSPPMLNHLIGDQGARVLDVSSSAQFAAGLAPPGVLAETSVAVSRTATWQAPAPRGFRDLATRVPRAEAGAAQVRIEKYGAGAGHGGDSEAAWIVYIGGTVDDSFTPGDEPWDMTSNVSAIAGAGAGSYVATVQAMRDAGIRREDRLLLVGHSQGGIVANRIAASGEFGDAGGREDAGRRGDAGSREDAGGQEKGRVGLLTFGSPVAQIETPGHIAGVRVEHTDDIIPALGGAVNAPGDGDRLLVRRMVYGEEPPPAGAWLPAHSLSNYTDTARLMDSSTDPRIVEFERLLGAVTGAKTATVMKFRGERMSR